MPKLTILGQAHVCQRCAERGPTCCEPEDGVGLAPLTSGDIRRIARSTKLRPESFVVEQVVERGEIEAIEESDPILRGIVGADGILRSLARNGRACVFHERERGCVLSYSVRPVLCRRFPVVRDRGKFRVNPGGDCLAIDESPDMPALLRLMEMTEEDMARVDRLIRQDLRDGW